MTQSMERKGGRSNNSNSRDKGNDSSNRAGRKFSTDKKGGKAAFKKEPRKYSTDKDKPREFLKKEYGKFSSEKEEGREPFKREPGKYSSDKGGKRDFSKREPGKYSSDKDKSREPFKRDGKSISKGPGKDYTKKEYGKPADYRPRRRAAGPKKKQADTNEKGESLIRLNKYIADAGICSRREADVLIESGVVKVNGVTVTQLGTKVSQTDKVMFGGETLSREKLRYVLLNKPKGFITTSDDPMDRKTVMSLVENACEERIYPVGRLDRNTIGLLLFTNDGDLAKKLTHPKYGIKKVYHVFLDKPLSKTDMIQIIEGVELEDGLAKPDKISYVTDENDKKQVGIELHSGKNRIVRRIFEHLGYEVVKLDRVSFAGLTKKDLPRGKWRLLSEKEVGMLKMIG
jgi:23S rRNA pseudouridine2605 synthase